MQGEKVRTFMRLAGQQIPSNLDLGDRARRELGTKLLLSEVLEFAIKGLGVKPVVNGKEITDPDDIEFVAEETQPDKIGGSKSPCSAAVQAPNVCTIG